MPLDDHKESNIDEMINAHIYKLAHVTYEPQLVTTIDGDQEIHCDEFDALISKLKSAIDQKAAKMKIEPDYSRIVDAIIVQATKSYHEYKHQPYPQQVRDEWDVFYREKQKDYPKSLEEKGAFYLYFATRAVNLTKSLFVLGRLLMDNIEEMKDITQGHKYKYLDQTEYVGIDVFIKKILNIKAQYLLQEGKIDRAYKFLQKHMSEEYYEKSRHPEFEKIIELAGSDYPHSDKIIDTLYSKTALPAHDGPCTLTHYKNTLDQFVKLVELTKTLDPEHNINFLRMLELLKQDIQKEEAKEQCDDYWVKQEELLHYVVSKLLHNIGQEKEADKHLAQSIEHNQYLIENDKEFLKVSLSGEAFNDMHAIEG